MKKLRYTLGPSGADYMILATLNELLVALKAELECSHEDSDEVWEINTVMKTDDEMVALPEFDGW